MSEEQTNTKVELKNTGVIELPKFDVKPYIGKTSLIEKVTEHKGKHGYFIKVETVKVAEMGETEINASKIFGLYEDEQGNIGWGSETKLGLFLKKMGVEHYKDLVGHEVILQSVTSNQGVDFLTFN